MEASRERILLGLRKTPMFRGLKPEELQAVALAGSLTEHDRGDWLWRTGDEASSLTVILRGRVKIVRETPDGGSMILELFGPGEPVGAVAMYNYMPYPAGAVCMEPVTLFRVPRRDYFELLDRNPEIARGLIRELTRIVVGLTHKVEELRGSRIEVRIAKLFLMFGQRMGKAEGAGLRIPLALSRQEIADLVGTTVESAIRTLSGWGRSGLVITEGEGFLIPDVVALERLAAGDEPG